MNAEYLPRHFDQSTVLKATCEQAFEFLDDFERLGAHMMRASWRTAGSSMRYEFDTARGRARGARIRLMGSVLGVALNIEEQVIEREPPLRKSWVTIGKPRMLVVAAYRLGFWLRPEAEGTRLEVSIDYSLPANGIGRLLGALFGDAYARWCVRSMVATASEHFAGNASPTTERLGMMDQLMPHEDAERAPHR